MALGDASSSSSVPFSHNKYDVFISFRGEDTRTNFSSHLHDAFCRKQIQTYIDCRLNKGDEISSALMQAIEDSYVSVVIFSENYASSRWCLDELIQILHCRKVQGQVVVPVFYKVDPSHVRHQIGTYKAAFEKHERDLKHQHKVPNWKAALDEIANLAGWDSRTFRDDSELIYKIVKDVLEKLNYRYPLTQLKGLVGIDINCAQIELLLKEAQTIGIWGMGGIGKTTIARAIFIKCSSQYESCCFLANVRENCGEHGKGLEGLLSKLQSELLEEEDLSIGTSTFVESRLNRKKVFIVLDDVSTLEQLEYLIGEIHYFAPGSRIIITTRDKHVLSKGVDVIYKVKELKFQESFKLFSLNAFNQDLPIVGFDELSKRAVAYARGIPLALKVLGSFLRHKSENEWNSALRKLEKIPHEDIQKVLRLSYYGLNHEEKKIFLDIACFLKGVLKEQVISLLDGYGFYGAIGIRTLQDKALIIANDNMPIHMHDLVQEMGWEIVREESMNEPERRSRLWDSEEIYDVLANNKGTDKIEGIMLNVSRIRNVYLSANVFNKMPNLRFLRFYRSLGLQRSSNVHLLKGLKLFHNKLTYLEWWEYPLKSLPTTFCPTKLVKLCMRKSQLKRLWNGVQDLVNLKEIDLSRSEQLIELPDLSKASNLEKVDLSSCGNLLRVHSSILSLHSLVSLNLWRCRKLKSLRSEIHLRSLNHIKVGFCYDLVEFSVSSEELTMLDLRRTGIKSLHSSIARSSKLEKLYLSYLTLKDLPNGLSCLRSLTELDLSNCVIDNWKIHNLFDGLRYLRRVSLDNCFGITQLPSNTKHLSKLISLDLHNCMNLYSLPKLPPSIQYLNASNCFALETVFNFTSVPSALLKEENGRYISFKNCMRLDDQSLGGIIEGAHCLMVEAAYGIAQQTTLTKDIYYIMRKSWEVCFPGSRLPNWFKYRTREAASVTMELPPSPQLLGFVFCIVLDSIFGRKEFEAGILCDLYWEDFIELGRSCLPSMGIREKMNSDHVYMWYSPWDCEKILKGIERKRKEDQVVTNRKVSFEFSVQTFKFVTDQKGFGIKECGVCPIYVSECEELVQQMEHRSKFEWNKKRPRDVDEQDLLPQSKKLRFGDLATQTKACDDADELAALFKTVNIT